MSGERETPVGSLCRWVERHVDRFRPADSAGRLSFRDVKPLGELSLVLYTLTRRPSAAGLAGWARRVATRLWPSSEESFAPRRPGSPLVSRSDAFPALETLLPVILLERITGLPAAFHQRISRAASAAAGAPASISLGCAFVCDLAGLLDCRAAAERALAEGRAEWDAAPAPPRSWLYGITHAIFYATLFGTRPISYSPPARQQLAEQLAGLAAERLGARRFDIAAELLACVAWVDAPSALPAFRRGLRILAGVACDRGCIPTGPHAGVSGDEFGACYHATLMTLAALAGTREGEHLVRAEGKVETRPRDALRRAHGLNSPPQCGQGDGLLLVESRLVGSGGRFEGRAAEEAHRRPRGRGSRAAARRRAYR